MKPPFPFGTIENFFPNTPNFLYSNFYPVPVVYDGVTYPTVEHAYQAAKTLDLQVRKLILACQKPGVAKNYGRNIKLCENWDVIKFGIMEGLLNQKFAPDTPFARNLLDTGTRHMIEGNYWHDLVWGQCFCDRHKWDGANRLGGLLMNIREELNAKLRHPSTQEYF